MKTLTDFKRDIQVGKSVICVDIKEAEYLGHDSYGELKTVPIALKLAPLRLISHIDTTGFYLKEPTDDSRGKGSFCGFPKASNLKYEGEHFEITECNNLGTIYQKRLYQLINN